MNEQEMTVQGLLQKGNEIWGEKKCDMGEVVVRLGVVFGDLCRHARNEKKDQKRGEDELKKELGNVIFSGVRWCEDLGLDPEECIREAIKCQEKFVKER